MVIQTWQVLLIVFGCIGLIGFIVVRVFGSQYKKMRQWGKKIGFDCYILNDGVPAQYQVYLTDLPDFRSLTWLLAGNIEGRQVLIFQFIRKIPGRIPTFTVAFCPFVTPVNIESKSEQIQFVQKNMLNQASFVTSKGVFFYPSQMFPQVNEKNILEWGSKAIEATKVVEG